MIFDQWFSTDDFPKISEDSPFQVADSLSRLKYQKYRPNYFNIPGDIELILNLKFYMWNYKI